MATVNCYISFNGNCEAAFNFYKSVFGGEFAYIGRFKDMPSDPNFSIPEEDKEKILHIGLPISAETMLLGADTTETCGGLANIGNNVALSINVESEVEAKRIFNALSEGGKVIMPLEIAFWGALYGYFCDKFGVFWMVSYSSGKQH